MPEMFDWIFFAIVILPALYLGWTGYDARRGLKKPGEQSLRNGKSVRDGEAHRPDMDHKPPARR